jgi:hypothetical protein
LKQLKRIDFSEKFNSEKTIKFEHFTTPKKQYFSSIKYKILEAQTLKI